MNKTLACVVFVLMSSSVIAAAPNKKMKAKIAEIKQTVTANFKDPDSAKFRGLLVFGADPESIITACGEVNAKNSYGAYVGYKKFFTIGTDFATVENEDNAEAVLTMIERHCNGEDGKLLYRGS
jgi:hypothetical protein